MGTVAADPGRLVILDNVSWETYRRLSDEHTNRAGVRMSYNEGDLQIMVVSARHEWLNRTLGLIVDVTAAELKLDIVRLGSTTLRHPKLEKALEPDSCFYVRNSPQVLPDTNLDLTEDAPPDLAIEVDITSTSMNRMPIYAALGVREVWRCSNSGLEILGLSGRRYEVLEISEVLPPVTAGALDALLAAARELPSSTWFRRVQDWIRAQDR